MVLVSHPIQYLAPLFAKMATHEQLDIMVYYCWDFGVGQEQYDPGFGQSFVWDRPLLNGYPYKFLKNYSPNPSPRPLGQVNPGIIPELWQQRYDAIVVHGYTTISCWLAFLGAWLTDTPIILRGAVETNAWRPLWKRILKTLVVSPLYKGIAASFSEDITHTHHKIKYGLAPAKDFLIPSCVDNDYFQENARAFKPHQSSLRQELGFPPDKPIILFLNKLIERKRPLDLLQAFAVIFQETPADLVFVGDGPERPKLEDYIAAQAITGVYFAGFKNQSEVGKYFSVADIFVLPSQDDASPKSLNEALNFSLPVIVSDGVGTATRLVIPEGNGYIYPRSDIKALTQCLRRMLASRARWEEMGKVSLQIANQNSYAQFIDTLLAALKFVTRK